MVLFLYTLAFVSVVGTSAWGIASEQAASWLSTVNRHSVLICGLSQLWIVKRSWDYLRAASGDGRCPSGWRAVGLLCVQLFNIYWYWVVYTSWAARAKAALENPQDSDVKISTTLPTVYLASRYCGCLLVLSLYTGLLARYRFSFALVRLAG